ncbi:tetratricopeptide repeat protein [Fulvivirga sedimenti]|uniref:Tetratricopeptide repeat protein n=1 Tax=Fulvivirga sedimenti TaxID=2879465 RepID=A0A9X1HLZ8_9BACT|nr:tetratricopeptide repeat protein [Fulvivirga sedimenti]MCA6073450.1 tetratricopeptide repeat protein [Fulvivirga sedimenti]
MKTLLLSLLFMTLAGGLYAQDIGVLQETFKQSYAAEADSNYSGSVKILMTRYDPSSYLMNARLGWLHYLNGQYFESVQYYEKAISLMPYAIEAKLGKANPLSMMGNWEDVIKTYEEILMIDPQHSLTNYRLGLIYYNRQEYDKAMPHVERVANMYPFDYYAVVLLGWINLKMGRNREARVLFEKALQILPEDPSALEGLRTITK